MAAQSTILKTKPQELKLDLARSLAWAAATHGKGRYRQLREMAALVLGRQKLQPIDYFAYGMFRNTMSADERHRYVSEKSGERLNVRLAPRGQLTQHSLLENKVLAGFALQQAGFPVLETRALYSARFRARTVPHLGTAGDIAEYLGRDGVLPCFGKPVNGSVGVGAASFVALSKDGETLTLGDGREVSLAALADEIVATHGTGYLFQPLIQQHPAVEALNGPATGMLRVVTVRTGNGAQLLYVVQKMPDKGVMADTPIGSAGNGHALVDPATGAILRAQDARRFCSTPLERSLATDVRLEGSQLPLIPESVELALSAHALFPGHGILGFDIALTRSGPLINEINGSPFHRVYQRAADRGLLNADFLPLLQAAEAETRRMESETGRKSRTAGIWRKARG